MRVLVVEDEKISRDFFVEELGHAGYHTASSDDGASALAMLRSSKFDAVVCDLVMPRMGGMEFLYEAHKEGTLVCPVVVVTGAFDQLSDRREIAEVLIKPVSGRDLVNAVNHVTGRSK